MEINKSEIYREYIHRRDRQAIISSIIPDLYNSDESFKANDDKFIKEVDEKGLWISLLRKLMKKDYDAHIRGHTENN